PANRRSGRTIRGRLAARSHSGERPAGDEPMKRASPERVRIALVDDHPFVREGVRAVLESSPELEIVGEASNAQEALEMAERASPAIMLVHLQRLLGIAGLT